MYIVYKSRISCSAYKNESLCGPFISRRWFLEDLYWMQKISIIPVVVVVDSVVICSVRRPIFWQLQKFSLFYDSVISRLPQKNFATDKRVYTVHGVQK